MILEMRDGLVMLVLFSCIKVTCVDVSVGLELM